MNEKKCMCPFCGKGLKTDVFRGITNFLCEGCGAVISFRGAEQRDAAIRAVNRRAQSANDPLTLEQLREMDGQPVWVVPNRGIAKWYLVDVANDCCSTCDMDVVDFELYGPKDKSYGWLAYRRRENQFLPPPA